MADMRVTVHDPCPDPPGTRTVDGASVAVIVLTHNEEVHIERLMRNLQRLGSRVFVVDSFSTDKTAAIAASMGATVVKRRFINYALQFQWALDNLPFVCDWVMRLDADELLSPELVEEIQRRLPALSADVTGININRRHIFMGRWIRFGGRYPLVLLRIWRLGAARIETRWMDEHMVLLSGRAVSFTNDFSDHNLNDLGFFIDKHNKYATREAIDVLLKRYAPENLDRAVSRKSVSRQAASKRWLKEHVYNRMPFGVGPLGYFVYRYVFQLGFLDGTAGFVYHALQGFWYRFLVAAKAEELDRALKPLADSGARLNALARLTGYHLTDFEGGPHRG